MVREFAREDERRVMLVLDPFIGPPRGDLGALAKTEHAERFERAVSMAACIAWHFHEINSVMQFRTDRFSTPMAAANEIIYDTLRELALVQPDVVGYRRRLLECAGRRTRDFQNHNHQPRADGDSQRTVVFVVFRLHRHAVNSHHDSIQEACIATLRVLAGNSSCENTPRMSIHLKPRTLPHFSIAIARVVCASSAAICRGARVAIRIACGWRRSCCSRRGLRR